MSEKIVLVHRDGGKRIGLALALSMCGHEVRDFSDGQSALSHIVKNGEAPFVLVGEMDMGDVYSSMEMKRCLRVHSGRTGVNYGIIGIDVPDEPGAKAALGMEGIGHTHGSDVNRIRTMVKYVASEL